ncbi:MAG TPA: ABC transporter ATP-binding protein [Candidatus Binatia bacterium]|nr:ABC transporter ATP-binding protein [Candidatus Binatia bacterium]
MHPVIRCHNVGKAYQLHHGGSDAEYGYRTLRETLMDHAAAPLRWLGRRNHRPRREEFWALRDVSFDVQHGEVVGIIGANGAGKSTLLKVLSRITRPSRGCVELRGRTASLLEVGTGFHPELTGRENIYLNGSILGMSRREIARRFDEIVSFAEVEQFLDTPVKRYSSGMYVRLAFAVAAHLDPEIMLIDEVLAVGDALFQHRCIQRMSELARSGRSLLFVSHNLELIKRFCQRAILLHQGRVRMEGDVARVVGTYLADHLSGAGKQDLTNQPRKGSGKARFSELQILDSAGRSTPVFDSGTDLRCMLTIESSCPLKQVSLAVVVKTLEGTRLISSWTDEVGFKADLLPGRQQIECRFYNVRPRPGRQVIIQLWMRHTTLLDCVENATVLDVVETRPTGFSARPDQGAILFDYDWIRHS